MTAICAAIAAMRAKGIPADDILDIVEAMAAAQPAHVTMASPIDESAERRRAKDRERKREKAESLRKSAEICGKSAEQFPSSEEKAPIPPKTQPSPSQEKTPKGVQKKGSELPEDWRLTDQNRRDAERIGLHSSEVDREAEKFRDYWRSKPGAGRLKTDWPATWRNWCRNVVERRSGRAPPGQQTSTSNGWMEAAREFGNHDDERDHNPKSSQAASDHDAGSGYAHRLDGQSAETTSRLAAPLLDFERPSPDDNATWGFGGAEGGTGSSVHPRR